MAWTEAVNDAIMVFQFTGTASGTTIAATVAAGTNTGFIVGIDVAEGSTDPGAWTLVLTDVYGTDMLDGQGSIPDNGIYLSQADLGNGIPFVGPLTLSGSGINTSGDVVVTIYVARYQ